MWLYRLAEVSEAFLEEYAIWMEGRWSETRACSAFMEPSQMSELVCNAKCTYAPYHHGFWLLNRGLRFPKGFPLCPDTVAGSLDFDYT